MVADARAGVTPLRDGRALAYAEWGPPDGRPVLHFHGVPDGRFSWGGGPLCWERGIRVITVDRPGIGGSDPRPDRTVADWPADVAELADQLGVDCFAISGWSAGAGYALACAQGLAPRVEAVALISGAGRLDLPGFVAQMSTAAAWRLAGRLPSAMTFAYSAIARLGSHWPGAARKVLFGGAPQVDRAVIDRPDVGSRLILAYLEATKLSGGGLTEDMQALLRPWGFEPSEVRVPVHVIHGQQDRIAPPAHAEYWIETLEGARLSWVEDAGHFLLEDHTAEILEVLAA